MSVKTFLKRLETARGTKQTLFVTGPTGIGKSEIVKQFAESKGVNCHIHTLYGDSISVLGIPKLGTEFTEFQKSMILKCKEGDIVFLDEITNCESLTVATVWSLISDGMIGGHKLPENVQIVLAGNNPDHSKIAKILPEPLRARLVIHEYNGPTKEEFQTFAAKTGYHPMVSSFLSVNFDMMSSLKTEDDQKSFPCPRKWHYVSDLLNYVNPDDINDGNTDLFMEVSCRIGESAAQRFRTYFELNHKITSNEEILKDPENVSIENLKDERIQWIQIFNIIRDFKEDTFLPFSKYLQRMSPENQILFLSILSNAHEKVLQEWMMNDDCVDIVNKIMDKNQNLIKLGKGIIKDE